MGESQTNLLHGTLDLLILKAIGDGEFHGLGISRRVEQITHGTFRVRQHLRALTHFLIQIGFRSSFVRQIVERCPQARPSRHCPPFKWTSVHSLLRAQSSSIPRSRSPTGARPLSFAGNTSRAGYSPNHLKTKLAIPLPACGAGQGITTRLYFRKRDSRAA